MALSAPGFMYRQQPYQAEEKEMILFLASFQGGKSFHTSPNIPLGRIRPHNQEGPCDSLPERIYGRRWGVSQCPSLLGTTWSPQTQAQRWRHFVHWFIPQCWTVTGPSVNNGGGKRGEAIGRERGRRQQGGKCQEGDLGPERTDKGSMPISRWFTRFATVLTHLCNPIAG